MTKPNMTITIPTDSPETDAHYIEFYNLNYGDRFNVLVLRAGDIPTSVSVSAGICPECGRDLTACMNEVDPSTLCAQCTEQWKTWREALAPIGYFGSREWFAEVKTIAF